MTTSDQNLHQEVVAWKGMQEFLERYFIEDYLERCDLSLQQLQTMPEEKAAAIMRAACSYASCRLAEIEAKSHWVKTMAHHPFG